MIVFRQGNPRCRYHGGYSLFPAIAVEHFKGRDFPIGGPLGLVKATDNEFVFVVGDLVLGSTWVLPVIDTDWGEVERRGGAVVPSLLTEEPMPLGKPFKQLDIGHTPRMTLEAIMLVGCDVVLVELIKSRGGEPTAVADIAHG